MLPDAVGKGARTVGKIQRDQWDRPLLPDPSPGAGNRIRPWTRPTTLAGTIEERWNIERWSKRCMVKGFAADPDLVLHASAAGDDRDRLEAVADRAEELGGGKNAADRGTSLHEITELHDRGQEPHVPPNYRADLEAYQRAIYDSGVTILPEWIERMTLNLPLECAGTPDRIVKCPRSSKLVIWDLKTSAEHALKFSLVKWAAQLAIYAHATHWLDDDNRTWHEMPEIEQRFGLICHLPAGSGKATVHMVDLVKGTGIVKVSHQVRQWRRIERLTSPYTVPYSDGEVRRRIGLIKDALGDNPLPVPWPEGVPTPSSLDRSYTPEEASAVGTWCNFVEEQLGLVPF